MEKWTPETLQEKLEQGHKVFLKLWKKGCGACKLSEPAIERLMAADAHGLAWGAINVDDHPEMLEIAETDVMPAFFIFTSDGLAGKQVGFKGLAKLQEFLKAALGG